LDWTTTLLVIVGVLLFLFLSGMPIAFCFLLIDLVASFILWGKTGPEQLVLSLAESVGSFVLLPLPLFILMGTVMFYSGLAPFIIEAVDRWLGNLPGRLSLLAVSGGALLSTFTGASVGSVAMLGSTLIPQMEQRGYKKPMTLGPILGSGGLAIMIPPSALAVLLGVIGEISVGRLLIAIILPGLLMALLYAIYIITRCLIHPSIAPAYRVEDVPFFQKVTTTVIYVLPLGFIVFMVVGVIFLGIATPTEASATGALGTFILAACYRKLKWPVFRKAVSQGLETSLMVLTIIVGAKAFSQILGFSGASTGLIRFATGLDVSPMIMFLIMQLIILAMGMFMDPAAILMVTLPLFIPLARSIGLNELVFAVVSLINIEMSVTSPPFGFSLFVMKGVAPPGTKMSDIYIAALPFLMCDIIAIAIIITFPMLALWLPGLMF